MNKPQNTPVTHPYDSTEDAYQKGFNRGLIWTDNWIPGGPWVYNGDKYPESAKFAKACNDHWRQGWRDGREAAKKT